MKRIKMHRRDFLKGSAFITSSAVGASLMVGGNPELEAAPLSPEAASAKRTTAIAQCPYCGVGCGTIIISENGKIVSMRPDKDHPTNYGLQCIKGLTAAEPIYVDRMQGDPYVRKDVWEEWNKPGHGDMDFISKTKGSFDEQHFVRVPYEKASDMTAHKIAHFAKKYGGNSIALYGSGQLTMEGQYLENVFMKGVLGSNTIEANARMCMTSAVTGYYATLGSDTPPMAYEDIELSDMIMHFGHNAREAHPIIFWRCADHKKKTNIPTVVADPRYTGTGKGYADINPKNHVDVPVLNGDISFLNAIAHVLLKEHEDVIDWKFLKAHTTGWKEYVDGVLAHYSPEQVQDRMGTDEVPPAKIRHVAKLFADATRKRLARGKDGHGGVVLGSECSGSIRNVFVENCVMDSPDLDRALRFKNNAVRGGTLENVFMRHVRIGRVGEAVLTIDLLYEEGAQGAFPPVVRNVQLDHITSSASPRVMFIRGFAGAIIDNIRISNSTFRGVTDTEVVTHTGSVSLRNVTIEPAREVRGLNSVGSPAGPRPEAPKNQ